MDDVRRRIAEVSPDLLPARPFGSPRTHHADGAEAAGGGGGGSGSGGGGGGGGYAANAARVIVALEDDGTFVETRDPFDAAHANVAPDGMLRPNAYRQRVGGRRPLPRGYADEGDGRPRAGEGPREKLETAPYAKRRKYPRSQILPSGVALDSAFDAMARRDAWLREELGLELVPRSAVEISRALFYATSAFGAGSRDKLRQKTRHASFTGR